jgi:putative NADPH-quinone reductase
MRVLYLYCHPLPESLHGAIRKAALDGLARAGHAVDLLDLYEEGFDPVLRADERRRYHDVSGNRQGLEPYVDRLTSCEALVVQFPVWCFGPPAMLKGFLDRLVLPGVAFDLGARGQLRPMLTNIRKIAGIATYGGSRLHAWAMGDPPRKLVTRYLRWFAVRGAPVAYHALHDVNRASEAMTGKFLTRVGSAMGRF